MAAQLITFLLRKRNDLRFVQSNSISAPAEMRFTFILSHRLQVGGSPTATYFSLLRQRKSKQKKGDRRLALRVLTLRFSIICACQKMGCCENSLRSDIRNPDPIFCQAQITSSQTGVSQRQIQKQRPSAAIRKIRIH